MISATLSRSSMAHTAATSPKARWRVRSGSPGPVSDRRASFSLAGARQPWGGEPGLAPHPGRLHQVVVGLVALLLPDDRWHILGNTLFATKTRAFAQHKRACQSPISKKLSELHRIDPFS